MNRRIYNRALEICRALKPQAQTGSKFHVSFLVKKSRITCIGVNNYNRVHLAHRFGEYSSFKFPGSQYRPSLHSECSLAIRAGLESWEGFEMLNIRIDNNGEAANSKPCANCAKVVAALHPKRAFYSVSNGEFEEFKFAANT